MEQSSTQGPVGWVLLVSAANSWGARLLGQENSDYLENPCFQTQTAILQAGFGVFLKCIIFLFFSSIFLPFWTQEPALFFPNSEKSGKHPKFSQVRSAEVCP